MSNSELYATQNNLLLNTLLKYYEKDDNLSKILSIINGQAKESLRLIDWFVTNYAKQQFIGYDLIDKHGRTKRFKVYIDYKLKLKAYSKNDLIHFVDGIELLFLIKMICIFRQQSDN